MELPHLRKGTVCYHGPCVGGQSVTLNESWGLILWRKVRIKRDKRCIDVFTKGQSGTGPQPMGSPETAPKMKESPYLWRGQVSGLNCACPHTGAQAAWASDPSTGDLVIVAFYLCFLGHCSTHAEQRSAPRSNFFQWHRICDDLHESVGNGEEAQSRETGKQDVIS